MDHRPLVLLLGDSLLMDGVAGSLDNKQGLNVLRMDAWTTDLQERLKALSPELIVFELDTPRSPAAMTMVKELPGTPLFGLDLTCSQVLVLNSSQYETRTMQDLCELAQDQVNKCVSGKEAD